MRRLLLAVALVAAAGATIPAPPAECAAHLGIAYTVDQGATDHLAAFARCTS